jgi:hypothetical protein
MLVEPLAEESPSPAVFHDREPNAGGARFGSLEKRYAHCHPGEIALTPMRIGDWADWHRNITYWLGDTAFVPLTIWQLPPWTAGGVGVGGTGVGVGGTGVGVGGTGVGVGGMGVGASVGKGVGVNVGVWVGGTSVDVGEGSWKASGPSGSTGACSVDSSCANARSWNAGKPPAEGDTESSTNVSSASTDTERRRNVTRRLLGEDQSRRDLIGPIPALVCTTDASISGNEPE